MSSTNVADSIPKEDHHHHRDDDGGQLQIAVVAMKDVILWRRWKLSIAFLTTATAIWALLEIYGYNGATVASWAAMLFLVSLFLYGNALRVFKKEVPDLSGWEMTEEQARRLSSSIKKAAEGAIRWMFTVSCERDWHVFAGVVAGLLLLAYAALYFDFLIVLYVGALLGMTIPVLYVKYEDKIKRYEERGRARLRKIYDTVDDRVFRSIRHSVASVPEHMKKVE